MSFNMVFSNIMAGRIFMQKTGVLISERELQAEQTRGIE